MAEQDNSITVSVVAFGPLSEEIQRRQDIVIEKDSTISDLISMMNIQKWFENGLTVAINGDRCGVNETLTQGDEIALLPPVSGG